MSNSEKLNVNWAQFKAFVQLNGLSIQYFLTENKYILLADNEFFYLKTELSLSPTDETDLNDFLNNFKANGNKPIIPNSNPFALPLFRTKRNSTSDIEICAPNSTKEIKFLLTSELYTKGGCLIVEGAQFGDYVTAEVEDIDGVIPEAYRAAICEAWPTVSQYIVKEWVEVNSSNYVVQRVDTMPLVAKLSSGLYMCLHYHATSAGSDRKIAVNYYMNKKL